MRYSCIHLKKKMTLRILNEFLNTFSKGYFEKRFFSFKKEEINLKTKKCMKRNTMQNKRKQNHQIKFLTTKQTK